MAFEVGEKRNTLVRWRTRGRIPEHAWDAIIAAAKERGQKLSAAQILALNAPMKPRGAASPLHPNHSRNGNGRA